jgi:hypothetical protein
MATQRRDEWDIRRRTFGVHICFFAEEEVDELFAVFDVYGYHQGCPSGTILSRVR